MSPPVQTQYEVAGQTLAQMFHSLSSSWLCLLLCEDDTVSHWSKQNKFLFTVSVKMEINTKLSLGASRVVQPPPPMKIPVTCFTVPPLKHAMISEFWQMGKGHGSLNQREAEVNINKGRQGNVKEWRLLGTGADHSRLRAAGLFTHQCDVTLSSNKTKMKIFPLITSVSQSLINRRTTRPLAITWQAVSQASRSTNCPPKQNYKKACYLAQEVKACKWSTIISLWISQMIW